MKLAKWFSGLAAVFLLLSLVAVVGAAPPSDSASTGVAIAKSTITLAEKPSGVGAGKGGDKTPPLVVITGPTEGETVSDLVTIIATAEDDSGIKKVEYAVDAGAWTGMAYNTGDATYEATWDSTTVADDTHTITVRATDNRNNKAEASVTVTTENGIGPPPPPTADYELFIEIDYMEGHEPTPEVLAYIEWYYLGNNPTGDLIDVTFYVNDKVPLDPSVSDIDFWAIEADYNNLGDDKYTGQSANFTSKWKWVLFGTAVEGASNVVGYAYIVTSGNDALAGNYIFIADEAADSWAVMALGADREYAAEAVVLMHEMGHSIGIAKLNPVLGEVYDRDTYSVMSRLSVDNASQDYNWYYSAQYWGTRNMEYYGVS